jgi:toxin ParE1/3/4
VEKQYNVKITKYAFWQMMKIRDYIADELLAPQAAYDLFSEMKKTVASLENMPERNPLVDVDKWRKQGIRKIMVKNFIIYYWADDGHRTVHITAVVYRKRNQLVELGKMELE